MFLTVIGKSMKIGKAKRRVAINERKRNRKINIKIIIYGICDKF